MEDKIEQNFAPIKCRILHFLDSKRIKKEDFYKKINVTKSNFSKSALKSEVSASILSKILNFYPEISAEWLLTGKGSMLKDEHQADTVSKVAEEKGKMDGDAPKKETRCLLCEEKEKRIEELKDQISTLKDHVNVLQNLIKAK